MPPRGKCQPRHGKGSAGRRETAERAVASARRTEESRAPVSRRPTQRRLPTRRRRIDPLVVPIAAGVIVALLVLAVGVPALVAAVRRHPAGAPKVSAALIAVVPSDATMTLDARTATGTLTLSSLAPGPHRVRAERRGFETLLATITLKPGEALETTLSLKPLPQAIRVTAHPAKAAVTLLAADGRTLSGAGTLSTSVPSGKTLVTLSAPGYALASRSVFLDRPLTLDWWLDPAGQVVHSLGVFRCVPAPKGVALSHDGSRIWVTALVTQPSLACYDRAGTLIGSVDLGKSGAVEVIENRDGTRAYASQMQSASVFEIDTKTFKVLRQFKTGSSWTKVIVLSPDEKTLYAANWSGDDVSIIDLASGKCVRRLPTVDTPRGLYPTTDGKRLFVAGFGEQSLVGRFAVIDLVTGKSKTFFSEKGGAMRHLVGDENRGVLFASDMGKARIWKIDMRNLKVSSFAQTDSHPNTIDLSSDGKVLFVSCRGHNNPKSYYEPGPDWGSVLLFDASSGKPLDAIVGGNQCTALDVSLDGRTLVFSDFLDNRMRLYDIPPYATLAAGRGGRYAAHFLALRKPGWAGFDFNAGGVASD